MRKGCAWSYQDYDDFTNATATLRWKGHTLLVNAHKTLKGFMGPDNSFSSGAGNDETTEGRLMHYDCARTLTRGWT